MKLNKLLSMGICATSLLAIAAPMLAQTVSADDATLVSGAGNTVTAASSASGSSQASVGFKPGDLTLYQVPNFNFGTGKVAKAGAIDMAGSAANRLAVVVDNRSTANASGNGNVNPWTLNVSVDKFKTSSTDTGVEIPLGINDKSDTSAFKMLNLDQSTYSYSNNDVYSIDSNNPAKPLGSMANGDISGDTTLALVSGSKRFGVTGFDFRDPASVRLLLDANNVSKVDPNSNYTATVNWNLSIDPTTTPAPAGGAGA